MDIVQLVKILPILFRYLFKQESKYSLSQELLFPIKSNQLFYDDQIALIRVVSKSSLITMKDVSKLITTMSISVNKELIDQVGDFSLSTDRLFAFTGLSWE